MKKYFFALMIFFAAVAFAQDADVAKENSAGENFHPTNVTLPDMVTVRAGQFSMGSSKGERAETPVHKIHISTFLMMTTEVSQELYSQVMGENPSYFVDEKKPVESVSWFDAVVFCNRLSLYAGLTPCYKVMDSTNPDDWNYKIHQGRGMPATVYCDFYADGYRLPTEAEWEYAAVEGPRNSGYAYSGSSNINTVCWYLTNSSVKTRAVASKRANALGLYDLSGNVYEWVWDIFDEEYYSTSPSWDPTGPANGSLRCFRGGSYDEVPVVCRVASRASGNPSNKGRFLGFRVVRSVR